MVVDSLLIWDGCCIDDDGDDRDLDGDVPAVSLGVVWHDHGWCGHLHRSSVLMFPQPPKANICGRLGWLNVEKMQWAGQRREGVKDPNIKAQKKACLKESSVSSIRVFEVQVHSQPCWSSAIGQIRSSSSLTILSVFGKEGSGRGLPTLHCCYLGVLKEGQLLQLSLEAAQQLVI